MGMVDDSLSVGATGTQVTSGAASAAVAIPNDSAAVRARVIRCQALNNLYIAPRAATAAVTLGSNPISTTNASATVTVTHISHGRTTGDSVVIAGAATFNNVNPNGTYTITVVDANSYTFTAGTTANATGAGGGAAVTVQYITRCTVNEILLSPNESLLLEVKPFTHVVYIQETAAAKCNFTPIEC